MALLKAPSKQPKTNPSGPPGGKRQTQPGQVCGVPRRKLVLRRQRGAQIPV